MPRSLVRTKLTRCWTSGSGGNSFSICASALGSGQPCAKENLVSLAQGGLRFLGNAIPFQPDFVDGARRAGLPSAIMNGGTSCTTLEQPPIIASFPTRQN